MTLSPGRSSAEVLYVTSEIISSFLSLTKKFHSMRFYPAETHFIPSQIFHNLSNLRISQTMYVIIAPALNPISVPLIFLNLT